MSIKRDDVDKRKVDFSDMRPAVLRTRQHAPHLLRYETYPTASHVSSPRLHLGSASTPPGRLSFPLQAEELLASLIWVTAFSANPMGPDRPIRC